MRFKKISGVLSCVCVRVPVPEFWWLVIAFAFRIVAGKCQFCSTFASSAWKSGFSTYNFASRKRVQKKYVLFVCDDVLQSGIIRDFIIRGMLA